MHTLKALPRVALLLIIPVGFLLLSACATTPEAERAARPEQGKSVEPARSSERLSRLPEHAGHAAADEPADPFQQALDEATNYPIQRRQPGSLDHALALYDRIIETFPEHARLDEAVYAKFIVLSHSDLPAHGVEADQLVRGIIRRHPADTELGAEARLRFAEFHTYRARHKPFEDAKLAFAVLDEVEAAADSRSLRRADAVRYRARLLVIHDEPVEALILLERYFRETFDWTDAYWRQLKDEQPKEYQAWRLAFTRLNNEVTSAIARSGADDARAAAVLRDAHPILFRSELVREAKRKFEEKFSRSRRQDAEDVSDDDVTTVDGQDMQ